MLKFFLPVLALLVLVPTIIWGFPEVWALTAIIPSFIIAATLRHSRQRLEQPAGAPGSGPQPGAQGAPVGPAVPGAPTTPRLVRPGVIVLGGIFGLITGSAAVTLEWAAVAPTHITISPPDLTISATLDRVWEQVGDPLRRTRWDLWMKDVEPMGKGGTPVMGSQYRAVLALERLEVPATLTISGITPPTYFEWKIASAGAWTLENMTESVTLVQDGDQVRVHYELSYDVQSVFGRVAERIAVRRPVERMAEQALEQLRQKAIGVE